MTSELFNLQGKKALITGGGGAIGQALATGLAQHGSDIILLDLGQDRLDRAADKIKTETGRHVWTFVRDLCEPGDLEPFIADIAAQTDGIDIIINCAGINLRAPAEEMSLEVWNKVLQINLTASFAVSRAFCNYRRQTGLPGKIINIGSLVSRSARATVAAYNTSKAGVLMLTKSLAVDWAKYSINVNAIGPGYFQTEMTQVLKDDPEFDSWVCSRTPFGRWGQTNELVGAAVFLASAASDFVTGQIIYVDGGWTAAL